MPPFLVAGECLVVIAVTGPLRPFLASGVTQERLTAGTAFDRMSCCGAGVPDVGAFGTAGRSHLLPPPPRPLLSCRSLPATLAEDGLRSCPQNPGRRLTGAPRPRHTSRRQAAQPLVWTINFDILGKSERRQTLSYPMALESDDRTLLAISPDLPELSTFGDNREEAVARPVHALEVAIEARIHDRRDIPMPSRGETYAVLPTLTSVKVILYLGMREQGVEKAELARRLGWHMPHLARVLDVQHRSRLDQMDASLGVIGWQLHVTAAATADPEAAVVGDQVDATPNTGRL